MHFKHPEILYFLLALVIPILVHLFQLRRFKKTYFTNVKLLKEIQQQTRKSSTLKKWLLLATRLLLLASLIIAFAQPYFNNQHDLKNSELVFILDNSYSMQAKGSSGELLKKAIQDILENLSDTQEFSLITPTETFWNVTKNMVQKELQNIDYTSKKFQPDYLIKQINNKQKNKTKNYIVITDGITNDAKDFLNLPKENLQVALLHAENKSNIAVTNVEFTPINQNFIEMKIYLEQMGFHSENTTNLSVTRNTITLVKKQVPFKKSKEVVSVNLPNENFQGIVKITDQSLNYDNTFYFSITKPEKPKVLVIGDLQKSAFLKRIYTEDEFICTFNTEKEINFNSIEEQQIIVLNELNQISNALLTTLAEFEKNGGTIVFIPSANATISQLNLVFQKGHSITANNLFQTEKQITKINFNHPLYKDVFEKTITNFQFPKVNSGFSLKGNYTSILNYADGSPFLGNTNRFYFFTSAINKENSNFQNSPLIVPTFYKFGISNQLLQKGNFFIHNEDNLILEASLNKDEILTVENTDYSFIPNQRILHKKVTLEFDDYPEKAGNFFVTQNKNTISQISFNYPRTESNLNEKNEAIFSNFAQVSSVENAIINWQNNFRESQLWKWFLLATLLFILIELLIQKIIK